MCFIMFLGANHSWLEHIHGIAEKINGEYYGTGQTQLLGFVVVDMGCSSALSSAALSPGA